MGQRKEWTTRWQTRTHLVPGEDHSALLPAGVGRDLAGHEVLQMAVQLGHETCARRDAVRVEALRLRQLLALSQSLLNQLLRVARRPAKHLETAHDLFLLHELILHHMMQSFENMSNN